MRAILALVLLLQFGATQAPGPEATPEHLRWQRAVLLPAGASGQACVVLDATTFAHAAGRSADDLRLYSGGVETPFVQSTSEPAAADVQSAPVLNLGMYGGDVVFDLAMPSRPYTDVTLKLDGKDFVATVKVSGSNSFGGPATQLGTFTLFDLSRQGLSRSTTLPLQESTFATLHIQMHVMSIDGGVYSGLEPQIVQGADIPPSREAQTLYTPVAMTGSVVQKGKQSVITFQVPAHVPVERVAFSFAPGFAREFSRSVMVMASAAKKDGQDSSEMVTGDIWRITRNGAGGGPAIHQEKLSVDAEVASNLREPATVTVTVENGDDTPLPIQSVQLQMRQRTLCFNAAAGARYVLRYGDTALRAPVYDYARLFQPQPNTIVAQLGPELPNPDYHPRPDERPFTERHPELMWVALILVVAVLGGTALHSLKGKKHTTVNSD